MPYPADKVIRPLNNWGLLYKLRTNKDVDINFIRENAAMNGASWPSSEQIPDYKVQLHSEILAVNVKSDHCQLYSKKMLMLSVMSSVAWIR